VTAAPDGDDKIAIKIYDQGVGMSEDQRSRLFRQYERIERDDIRKIPGTGLGLYLVKNLVELHGGEINAEPRAEGKGTVFVVRLPINQPAS
jgi:two-component system, OmpR family, sensor histidine kinase BaeS